VAIVGMAARLVESSVIKPLIAAAPSVGP
jgi:hypothetical protein